MPTVTALRSSALRPATALVLAFLLPTAASGQPSRGALARGSFAITGVTVIPMAAESVIRDATVLVRDGRIAAVGSARQVRIPSGTRRIDGRGKFLVPGLADMHTHLYSDGETPDSAGPHELGVMLANGITAARLMMGTAEQLALRAAVTGGTTLGPQLWLASPGFTGQMNAEQPLYRIVRTPEDARLAVREVAAAGYDFVKLTTQIPLVVYDAIVEEARAAGIRVTGHVDLRVGVPRALEAGQQIEHLDGYLEAILADSVAGRVSVSGYGVFQPRNWESLDHVDEAKIGWIAGLTARAGAWITPTLVVFNRAFAQRQAIEELRSRPDWEMITPGIRRLYLNALRSYWNHPQAALRSEARRHRYVELRGRLTREIHRAGGRIIAGSDSPEWFFAYGWALHYELEALVQAGLSAWEALAAATVNPAEYLGALGEWGTIQQGRRADMLLLAADPLADIRNTRRIDAVVIGGRVLERNELDALIAAGSRAISGAPPDSLRSLR